MLHASEHVWAHLRRTERLIYSGSARDRADWMELYYRSGAWLDLSTSAEDVYQRFQITERTRDSCGEMGDGAEVVAEVLRRVDADPQLGRAIEDAEGETILNAWRLYATQARQQELF